MRNKIFIRGVNPDVYPAIYAGNWKVKQKARKPPLCGSMRYFSFIAVDLIFSIEICSTWFPVLPGCMPRTTDRPAKQLHKSLLPCRTSVRTTGFSLFSSLPNSPHWVKNEIGVETFSLSLDNNPANLKKDRAKGGNSSPSSDGMFSLVIWVGQSCNNALNYLYII